MFNSPAEGLPWDDLGEIFSECQWMAKVPNAVEILQKIWTAWVERTNVTDDRPQTDDRRTGDSIIANVNVSSRTLKASSDNAESCDLADRSVQCLLCRDSVNGAFMACAVRHPVYRVSLAVSGLTTQRTEAYYRYSSSIMQHSAQSSVKNPLSEVTLIDW